MRRYCLNSLSAITDVLKQRSLNEISNRSLQVMMEFKHRVTGEAVEQNGVVNYEPDSYLLSSSIQSSFSAGTLGTSIFNMYGQRFDQSASLIPALRNTDSSIKAIQLQEPYSWNYMKMVVQEGMGRSSIGNQHKKTFNLLCHLNCQSMMTSNHLYGLPREVIPVGSYPTQSSDISAYNLIRVTPGIIKAFATWMNRKLERTVGSTLRLYEVMSFDIVIPVLVDEEEYGIVPSLIVARKSSPGAYPHGINHLFIFNSDTLMPLLLDNGNVSTDKCKALYNYTGKALKATMAFMDTVITELRYETSPLVETCANSDVIYDVFSDVLSFDNYKALYLDRPLTEEDRQGLSQVGEDELATMIWKRALRKFESDGGPPLLNCPENKEVLTTALKKMWAVGKGVPAPYKPLYTLIAQSLQMLDILYLMRLCRKNLLTEVKTHLEGGGYTDHLERQPINRSFLPKMAKEDKLSLVAGVMIKNSSSRVYAASDLLASEVSSQVMEIRRQGKTIGFKDVLTALLGEEVVSELDDTAIPPSADEFFGEPSALPSFPNHLELVASQFENTSNFLRMAVSSPGNPSRNFTLLGKSTLRDIHLFAGIHACLVDFAYFLGTNSLINKEVIHGDSSFR